MSTSENETPPLTRRQLRELRNTGATPIITPEQMEADAARAVQAPVEAETPSHETDADVPAPVEAETPSHPSDEAALETDAAAPETEAAPVPDEDAEVDGAESTAPPVRAVAPLSFAPPLADAGPDQGVSGLTRRQARTQEKIRTASIPVVSPDVAPAFPPEFEPAAVVVDAEQAAALETAASGPAIFKPGPQADVPAEAATDVSTDDQAPIAVVNPHLGSELLQGATPEVTLPPSFDQLIARSATATGSISTPNALILSQTPAGAPLVAPITATGEVLITGTFDLPEGLGSIGHGPGTTDGRDADAVLIDGELPPASSPTPIAASAAISTVKQPGEIIRPPAPEKGSRLMIGLIITTGALAIAVAGALILAFTTGVF